MKPYYADDSVTLYHGDCRDVIASLPSNSLDACVTDPPYELGFMGRKWDASGIAYDKYLWAEVWRVLKPGAHVLAFGGTRTWHRLAVAIEDAGFEVRDSIAWQHSESVFCRCSAVPYIHDPDDVRGVREAVYDASGMGEAGQESDVLPSVQRKGAGARVGGARAQGPSGLDGRESSVGEGKDDGRSEPGMEGRRDVLAQGGELPGDQVRQGAGVGAADGAQGRLHHGASPIDGDDLRSPADALGSREPHQPQPAGQQTGESGAVPEQRGAQAWRGWPICYGCGKPLEPPFHPGPLAWQYGSGFPKSLDVSKAIDKRRDDREDVLRVTSEIARLRDEAGLSNRDLDALFGFAGMAGHWTSTKSQPAVPTIDQWAVLREELQAPEWMDAEVWRLNGRKGSPGEAWDQREVVGTKKAVPGVAFATTGPSELNITAPATDAAREWQGWGTALKPAFEPIVVARKPLQGTVAENVQRWGTGAINVDGCRIGMSKQDAARSLNNWKPQGYESKENVYDIGTKVIATEQSPSGRWPANVILDESQAAELDRQSGVQRDGVAVKRNGVTSNGVTGWGKAPVGTPDLGYGGEGGASRFFYTAKASTDERPRVDGVAHPTVKPLDLMQYLVRLVSPPGGTVLEPFAGSGTTLEACIVEGFKCVGIEITDEYLPLIMQRITKPIEVTLL